MRTTKPQKRRTEKKPEHKPEKAAPVKRSHMSQWYQPTIRDVYAAVCEAKTMLDYGIQKGICLFPQHFRFYRYQSR